MGEGEKCHWCGFGMVHHTTSEKIACKLSEILGCDPRQGRNADEVDKIEHAINVIKALGREYKRNMKRAGHDTYYIELFVEDLIRDMKKKLGGS